VLVELDELREQHRPLSREPRPITALAGNSMGGTWALWYALARPERVRGLVLLGSAPPLPGTRPPVPLRVTAAPLVGDLLPHLVKPNRELLIRLMASMGEKDTIVRYPQLIESLGAAAREPINSAANLAELQAIMSPFRFRRSARIAPDEHRRDVADLWLFFGSGSARRCHA
jgi:pimeloyl-ACP methyl ester carboxylesterase